MMIDSLEQEPVDMVVGHLRAAASRRKQNSDAHYADEYCPHETFKYRHASPFQAVVNRFGGFTSIHEKSAEEAGLNPSAGTLCPCHKETKGPNYCDGGREANENAAVPFFPALSLAD